MTIVTDTISRPASTALAAKLQHHVSLDAAECAAIDTLLSRNVRRLAHQATLVERGSKPTEINVMVEGWAARIAELPDGRRRVVAFYLPGDVCDFDVFLMTAMDQAIVAVGDIRVAGINRASLNMLAREQPRVSRGLWWESLVAAAGQRAWTINVGHNSGAQRLAHLLCELYVRLSIVGLAADGRCPCPLTQYDLGDACGLTAIHVNRVLRGWRDDGIVSLADRQLGIGDFDALARIGCFDPSYLQIEALSKIMPHDAPLIRF